MFRSLRFRLPAFFLAGVVVAGLVSTAIAVRLFQDYTRDRTYAQLNRESRGLAELYGGAAGLQDIPPRNLEQATGDRLFFIPRGNLSLEQLGPQLRELSPDAVDVEGLGSGGLELEF